MKSPGNAADLNKPNDSEKQACVLTMPDRLRIAVTGLAATYPFGGSFWDYIQYPLGFHRLGHDVLYIEDTGQWVYDPAAETFVEDGTANAAVLAQRIAMLEPALNDKWFF